MICPFMWSKLKKILKQFFVTSSLMNSVEDDDKVEFYTFGQKNEDYDC